MDRILDLVQQLEPEVVPPSVDAQARQRDALLRSMALAGAARTRPRRWRTRRAGWFAVATAAVMATVVAAILFPRSSSSPRPLGPAPSTSAVLTAITRALASASDDIEEVQTTVPGAPASTTSWVDVSTGACRVNISVNGRPSLTLFDEQGRALFIDYGHQEWWTRSTEGVTCEPLTPQIIEHDVSTGQYTVASRAAVNGQPSLKLVSTRTTTGLHPVTTLRTLWVNATTDLPIQSTSIGHLTAETVFTWLPATATNAAILNVTVPTGFRHVDTPPTEIRLGQ
jgi:hypothetical protein